MIYECATKKVMIYERGMWAVDTSHRGTSYNL